MRLIDAGRFERVLTAMPDDELCEDCCYNVVNKLDEAPTIDAVEVVRCEDCTHYGKDCVLLFPADGYCYDGKRREE